MSYDSHSKQILLIAIVHILGYLLNLLGPATSGMKVWQSNEGNNLLALQHNLPNLRSNLITVIYGDSEIVFTLLAVSLYILMIVLAGVMIRGVLKVKNNLKNLVLLRTYDL